MHKTEFESDPQKARANLKKHGISFEEPQTVFSGEDAKLVDDPDHSEDEDRIVLLGLNSHLPALVVCHCHRGADNFVRTI